MTKKLNIGHIRSELADSVFFREPRPPAAPPAPGPAENPPTPPTLAIPERPNARAPERAAGPAKRSFVRRSFDFYEDQVSYLTRVSLEERMAGREGSMNAMVREALDDYIQKKRATRK